MIFNYVLSCDNLWRSKYHVHFLHEIDAVPPRIHNSVSQPLQPQMIGGPEVGQFQLFYL